MQKKLYSALSKIAYGIHLLGAEAPALWWISPIYQFQPLSSPIQPIVNEAKVLKTILTPKHMRRSKNKLQDEI